MNMNIIWKVLEFEEKKKGNLIVRLKMLLICIFKQFDILIIVVVLLLSYFILVLISIIYRYVMKLEIKFCFFDSFKLLLLN